MTNTQIFQAGDHVKISELSTIKVVASHDVDIKALWARIHEIGPGKISLKFDEPIKAFIDWENCAIWTPGDVFYEGFDWSEVSEALLLAIMTGFLLGMICQHQSVKDGDKRCHKGIREMYNAGDDRWGLLPGDSELAQAHVWQVTMRAHQTNGRDSLALCAATVSGLYNSCGGAEEIAGAIRAYAALLKN